jgi:hypothetical protein
MNIPEMEFKRTIELNLLITTIILYFQRMAMPYINYVFIPLFIIVTIYFLIKNLIKGFETFRLRLIIKVFYPFLIVLFVFFLATIFSDQYNILIYKNLMQAVILTMIIILYSMEIISVNDYETFNRYFLYQVVSTSGIITVLGLIKMFITLEGVKLDFTKEIPLYTSSLNTDHNFFCLSVILGVISVIYIFYEQNVSRVKSLLLQTLLFLFSVSILFSTSRRGFVLFLMFLIIIVILTVNKLWINVLNKSNLRIYTGLFLSFSLLFLFYFSTYNSKLFFGIKRSEFNLNLINHTMPELSYRYGSVFGFDIKSIERLIPIDFDSKYPYTRWGRLIHEEVFPLTGGNVEIVPKGTVGYKIDRRTEADTWNGNAYAYTSIERLYKGDTTGISNVTFTASVYCFVSSDFNGTWVAIAAEGNSVGEKKKYYDLRFRDNWQKLNTNFSSKRGVPPAYLYVVKEGITDFKSLDGYVIFAYPEYLKTNDSILYTIVTGREKKHKLLSSFFDTEFIKKLSLETRYLFTKPSVQDTIKTDSFMLSVSGELSHSRIERWRYGYYLFKEYYTLKQKVMGNGFDYLNQFGVKFGEATLDYPHNPFISAFLYSGIIGGLIFLWYMFLVFYYYIKYLKYHKFFFVCFLIICFFSIVSADTYFSIPVFSVFCIFPFFTRYMVEKNKILDL